MVAPISPPLILDVKVGPLKIQDWKFPAFDLCVLRASAAHLLGERAVGFRFPPFGNGGPESRVPIPESRVPSPDSRVPNPEFRVPIPESRFPIPETRPRDETR